MKPEFTLKSRIARPVAEVFQAVVDPKKLTRYFAVTASGPLVRDAKVEWIWSESERETIHVHEVETDRRVVFCWRAAGVQTKTEVSISFEPAGEGVTTVAIHESGWTADQAGLRSSYEHCSGWQHMLLCLRAWLVFGIDLR